MIDSHCHLTDPRLLSQLDDVLARAQSAGVTRMITIGTSIEDDRAAVALCQGRDFLRCAIGVHPNYTHEAQPEDVDALRDLQTDPQVVALGEMGLDYHHNFADRSTQRTFFERQMQLATELGRPVIIHCRDAVDDTLALMRDFPSVPAVFHCFTGTRAEGERIVEAGYLLGFTGAVTFKRSDELRELVKAMPHDRLLVETDAPYLSPEPFRSQKVNEPALVVHVAATVAKAWGVSVEEVDQIATTNTLRLFRWPVTET